MRRGRLEIGGGFRVVHLGQRRREALPAASRDQQRVEPFGQRRQAGDRLADGAGQRLAGDAGGHRVDRLDQRQAGEIRLVDDVVRMDHGRAAVEPLDLAADIERSADRQRLFEVVAMGVEEGEADLAGVVVGEDPPRDAPVAARRLLVAVDAHLEGDDGAFRRQRDAGLLAAVDDADRQVEEEIDDARRILLVRPADQPAERHAELRPDAGKAGDRAEEGVEDVGAHGLPCSTTSHRADTGAVPTPDKPEPQPLYVPGERRAFDSGPAPNRLWKSGEMGDGAKTDDTLAMRRRRLKFRCWHQGDEGDRPAARPLRRRRMSTASTRPDSPNSRRCSKRPDQVILAWIVGGEPVPDDARSPLLDRLLAFYAA